MAKFQMFWIQASLLFSSVFFQTVPAQLIRPGPVGYIPHSTAAAATSSSCTYALSSNNIGNCVVTPAVLNTNLNTIKDDISRSRLQYVAQNSILQAQIAKIEALDTKAALRIDKIERDIQTLKRRTPTTTVGTGTSTGGLNLIQVRDSLLQNIKGVDSRVSSLTSSYQRDAVSQAQTNAALQQQLRKLVQDNQQLTASNTLLTQNYQQVSQDMQTLKNQVQALATQCAGCGSTNPPAIVTAPPSPTIAPGRLAKIEKDIKDLNNAMLQQDQDLAVLDNIVNNNHTKEINNLHLELQSFDARLLPAIQKTDLVYQSLNRFNTQTVPKLRSDIAALQQDTQTLQGTASNIQNVQRTLLNDTVFMKIEVSKLSSDLQTFNSTQSLHKQAIELLNNGLANALPSNPQISALQTNVNNLLSGKPPLVIPPILKPATTTTGSGLVFPPTLRPPGNG